jgi:hypothetical protein
MFRKFLSPDGGTSGGGGTTPPADPAPAAGGNSPAPQSQNLPAAGLTVEQQLAAALAEADRWKNGYAGLQREIANKLTPKVTTLEGEVLTHKTALETLQQAHTALGTEHETLKTQFEEADLERTTAKSALQRARIILAKYPFLASWEADGQLPESPVDAKDEDVEKLFQSFADKLATVAKISSLGAGGGPPPPAGGGGGSGNASADEELKQANAAMFKGDSAGYNLHFQNYLNLSQKGKK